MHHSIKIRIGIICLFILLIFIHLLPLSLHPFDALNDTRDCVLNTWIPGWVQQQMFTDPFHLFDTNAFYPHTNTLSYSEHLFPQALISLPVKFLTNNPVAVYNFLFLFSFFLNAYGMFLLARHLTKNDFIGIFCGIIFAFNTYQINQITHLQLLSSGLIPLAFLYLHKYLEEHNLKNSILFAVFFTLQSLACIYYGLFFISVLFILLPVVFFLNRKYLSFSFVLRLGIPLVFSSAVLALFSLPYLSFMKTFQFDRGLQKGADIANYLAVDFTNVVLSKILTPLGHQEHFLFPGIAALFFAVYFLYKKRHIQFFRTRKYRVKEPKENMSLILYVIVGIWTLFLSFGSHFFLFKLFFNYIPGFKGIRVPSRYGIFVIFSIAALAAYGLNYFLSSLEKKKVKMMAAAGLLIFLNLEYLSIPQQMKKVPVKDNIPPAYVWLKNQPHNLVAASLPFFNETPMEANYLYFSLFHKKKIINGYSGFVPPVLFYMQRIFKGFPSWPCVDILKSLGVDYVIYHPNLWENRTAAARVERIEKDFSDDLKLVKTFSYEFKKSNALSDFFGEDRVYQVMGEEDIGIIHNPALFSKLNPNEWSATASRGEKTISFLHDENLETYWNTGGPKQTGDFLLIEFVRPVSAALISLQLGNFYTDYALNLRAEISSDGKAWTNIPRPYSAGEFTRDWIDNPLEPVQKISIEGDRIKYVKIIHIGDDKSSLWSVAEMEISAVY